MNINLTDQDGSIPHRGVPRFRCRIPNDVLSSYGLWITEYCERELDSFSLSDLPRVAFST